VLLSIATLKMR